MLLIVSLAMTAAADTPSQPSLHDYSIKLVDDRGDPFEIGSLRGRPFLLTLFFARCTNVCPMTTAALIALEGRLPAEARAQYRALMVSFDSEHDGPEALARYRENWRLDGQRWHVASTSERTAAGLARYLGTSIRRDPNEMFSHAAVVALIGPDGIVIARSSRLVEGDEPFERLVAEAFLPTRP
jgi:protein SCO1